MAFEGFPGHAKSVSLSSGLTYSTVFFPKPAESSQSTILFLHGFPSSSYDWHNQISYFSSKGYGVIAPDLLGYGGSSSPDTLTPYTFKSMCEDLLQILRQCDIKLDEGEKVHIIGHDFGSILMGPLLGYFPQIALTASFLALPYMPAGQRQDLELIKKISEQLLGFEFLGYQRFLMSDESWKVIGEHKESFFTLVYGPEDIMISDLLPAGKMEAWLKEDRKATLQGWVTKEYKDTRDRIFAKKDAYRGPTDWYRSRFREFLGIDAETKECEMKIACPVLSLYSKDPNVLINGALQGMKKSIEDLELKELSVKGHFVQLEAPDEVNLALEEFLVKNTPAASKSSL